MKPSRRSISFVQALIFNVAGLVIALGLALLIAMVWQGAASTRQAARQEINETLNRAVERLRILIRSAEMTAESAERVSHTPGVTGATLRSTLESSLAAFEQRPELSYLGIVLPGTGEYGCLERTASGAIWLWLFPGTRTNDPVTRNFILRDNGFVLHEERPTDGYDPRSRPFYLAALKSPAGDTWIPTYQWIVHAANSEPLWGFSYVKAIRNDAGRPICVLDTDFDMPALNSFVKSLAAEYHCELQIVELGETPRLIGGPGVNRSPLPPSRDLAPLIGLSGDVFVDRMELDGERRWVAARRMELKGGVSWLIIASRKDTLIEAPLRRQLYQVVGMGLAMAAGLVLVSVRMARRFGRPLAELEQRVANFGPHEPEAAATTAASATDEFRETQLLGEAFSRMAVAVRQRERELSTQNSRLRSHLENTPLAVIEWDAQSRITSVNASAVSLFQQESATMVGQPVVLLVAPEDRHRAETVLDPARSAARQAQLFAKSRTGDGRNPDCEWYVTRLDPDEAGQAGGCALVLDVSQLLEAEEQKVASLALKAAIFDSTNTAIFSIDHRMAVIEWNAAAERMFGLERDRALGRDVAESVLAPDGPADWAAILDATSIGASRFIGANGAFDAELRLVTVSQNGREIRTLFLNDITAQRAAERKADEIRAELEQRVAHRTRELQTLNNELETFCYSVSHDLRAPLRGIAGFAEILAKNHAGALDETAQNYLGRILAATHRMGELIDDLLNLSRVSRDEMRCEAVDLSAIARDILADLRHTAPDRQVEVAVEDGLRAEGDARLLRVLLENLLGNAWKFTSKTPDARIAFTSEGSEDGATVFAVSDNGAGFDMRYADKLFGPFQRLHRATEFPGTGIGLATVQRIVSRHGGRISAQAEPGKGATFRFSL